MKNDGKHFYSSGSDATFKLWDMKGKRSIFENRAHDGNKFVLFK